jgi:N6-adenosine-specific RNA methylase IME4
MGGQRHGDSANMFSNSNFKISTHSSSDNFKLNYQTLSNEEIIDLDVESLTQSGFCFLWVTNSHLQFGLTCLNKWGYSYVDKITWVKKSKTNSTTIYVSTGYYLLHSVEICLIGVKHSTKNSKLQFISKVSNDVIFGKVGMQSQKPEEMYQLIEAMVPGGRKVEIFARNHW